VTTALVVLAVVNIAVLSWLAYLVWTDKEDRS